MIHSLPSSVLQVFADAQQPGYQGLLEVVTFLMMITMIWGAYAAAAALLWYAV